jgi:hypothetical protein
MGMPVQDPKTSWMTRLATLWANNTDGKRCLGEMVPRTTQDYNNDELEAMDAKLGSNDVTTQLPNTLMETVVPRDTEI